ncbi:MAG TPA: TRAP transporter TatT component family protein [Candidatus Polarisedimenticolia bacterium]
MRSRVGIAAALLLVLAPVPVTGCSIRKLAVNKLGDALADSGTSYASDDDPDLIGDATPFALKLIESLLEQSPRHSGLLAAAAGGFTQYAWAYVQQDADAMEDQDLRAAAEKRARARRLYLRAYRYGVRGLETAHPGITPLLESDPKGAARLAEKKDLRFMYWTAASLVAAISLSKDDPDRIADLPIVDALLARATELDPDYDRGALHELLINWDGGRSDAMGGSQKRARLHFERAMELAEGKRASPLVALAEMVSVQSQDRAEFESLLHRALQVDPDAVPEWRLENLLMQRRARWLLSRVDLLFAE